MLQMTLFSIVAFNLINLNLGNSPVPAVRQEECGNNEFYDSICMTCHKCGRNGTQANFQERAADGSCVCKPEYVTKTRKGPNSVVCTACEKETVRSADGSQCLKCGDSNPFNETLGHCEPCINGTFVDDGKFLTCQTCANAAGDVQGILSICTSSQAPNPKLCTQQNMVFSGGYCLSTAHSDSSLFVVKYENGQSVQSAFFQEHFYVALEKCKENNDTACQVLANMCTLLMYRISIENNACSEFRKLSKKRLDECPKKTVWLYYIDEEARWNAQKDLYLDNVPNVFVPYITEESSKLHIMAKKYALNGSFIGISEIHSNELHLCLESNIEEDIAFTVGTRIQRTCTRSLRRLWDTSEILFYELYLVDGSNKTILYPIPVLIRSIVVNGELINTEMDKSKWLLVRRFFLTDRQSGVEVGSSLISKHNQPIAKVFRYAADVSLKVSFKSDGRPGTIYPPLLIISYAEATPEGYMRNTNVAVKFSVSYEINQMTVMRGLTIMLAIFGIFCCVWSIVQTWSWFRRSGKVAVDLVTLGKFIIFMSGNLSAVFFAVLFLFSFYWFVFFKRQDVIYTILPTVEQESFLGVYLSVVFVLKAIHLIHFITVQCSIDIFFIDWERPRTKASSVSTRAATTSKTVSETSIGSEGGKRTNSLTKLIPEKIANEMAGVSIWRTYYAANEWAEIQSMRKISLAVQLFGVLFFLKVLNFEKFTLSALSFDIDPAEVHQYVPYSTCCRFALGALVYLSIAVLQVIFQKGIYERFIEDKLQQYVDLCSVSNISVFILVTKRFGYYIHGRSTHGKADVNMKEMHEFLRKEEEDLCGRRGLVPDSDQQTFQMLLPPGVHDQFLRLVVPLTSYTQSADRMQGVGGRLIKVDIDRVVTTHCMLNKFLAGFIDHSFKGMDYVVKDRVMLEYLLDIEFYEVAERGYFYNDDGRSFSSVLFYGNESILLLFDVLLFIVIDIASSDYVLAAILTFIFAKVIQGLRCSVGRRNLVRKALVDERFLM